MHVDVDLDLAFGGSAKDAAQCEVIQRAFRAAASVRRGSDKLRVGIADRDGFLLATGVLHGYSQAAMFAELLRRLGYNELLPRNARSLFECDLALVESAGTAGQPASALPQQMLDVDSSLAPASDTKPTDPP
jgi:hypothetical protein